MTKFKIVFILVSFLFTKLLFANENFSVIKDLKYMDNSLTSLDIYMPKRNLNKKVIFMVHGGAWRLGDKASDLVIKNKVDYWVSKGYVFISTNYRLLLQIDVFNQAIDVATALKFSQDYLKKYKIKSEDFILMGHSAGAHLISLLTTNPKIAYDIGVKKWLGSVSIDTAALNVPVIMNNKHKKLYDKAFGNDVNYWEKVSPYHQLKEKIVPFLAICSTKRKISCSQSEQFFYKAKSYGSEVEVLKINLNHRDINKNLGLDSSYTQAVDKFINEISK
jgi:dipeptidyl aminopeptidase/acylaminoacyl peptidase